MALADWVADMMVAERIRLFPMCKDSMHKELSCLGLPKKDHKWVRLAIGSDSPLIVTDDIDLFDPSKKNSTSTEKDIIKKFCKGPVPKYLRKNYKISVICVEHVHAHLTA